eukprot:8682011-Ditylum_brightwellii.AAC.1
MAKEVEVDDRYQGNLIPHWSTDVAIGDDGYQGNLIPHWSTNLCPGPTSRPPLSRPHLLTYT